MFHSHQCFSLPLTLSENPFSKVPRSSAGAEERSPADQGRPAALQPGACVASARVSFPFPILNALTDAHQCRTGPGCNIISVSLLFWTLGMTSTLLTGNAYSCVTLYLSSVLNSVPGLPSIRRAAVQAWLETVSGGSLVMFALPTHRNNCLSAALLAP